MQQKHNEKKGFAGLSSLVSDIDIELHPAQAPKVESPADTSDKTSDKEKPAPSPIEKQASRNNTAATEKNISPNHRSYTWKIFKIIFFTLFTILAIDKITSLTKSPNANTQYTTPNAKHAPQEPRSTNLQRPTQNPAGSSSQDGRIITIVSIAANIREQPNARSKVILSLKKGEKLIYTGETDNFTNVRLFDGRVGFISSELVISDADFERLSALSPEHYIQRFSQQSRLKELVKSIKSIDNDINLALRQVTERDANIYQSLYNLDKFSIPAIDFDVPAGIWYSNAARAANAYKDYESASLNSFASIEANPLNPDYYVAWGLVNHVIGNSEALNTASYALLALSPRTTNTWMLVGLSQAMKNGTVENDTLATGAFILAIKLSKNQNTTRKYFKDLIANSSNPRVKVLIRDALIEEIANPTLFSE